MRRLLNQVIKVACAAFILLPHSSAAQSRPVEVRESANVKAVWAREELYWQYAKAGDADKCLTLWADGCRRWSCGAPRLATKAIVANWVRQIRDQKIRRSYRLTREGAADFDDVVVVYYQRSGLSEYPDGRVEGLGRTVKITHTWRRFGDRWTIIGGMCGSLETASLP